MKKVSVTLKSGRVIEVMDKEVSGLREAGLLKEGKQPSETKEFKPEAKTKVRTAKEIQEANERMYPSKKRPVSIGAHSIKGGRPKKT